MPLLRNLPVGTFFRLSGIPTLQGVVVRTGECSIVVRLATPQSEVEFTDGQGEIRHFRARRPRITHWAPATLVEPLPVSQTEENDMTSSKSPTRLSSLAAAALVLQQAAEPLSCAEIVERMLTKQLWTTQGQTPAATIYAVLLREIQTKGKTSRFARVGPGKFAIVTPQQS